MKRLNIKIPELEYEMKEELKALRTNIQFCGTDKKVILVTSCIAGEGKSTVALNLAVTLSQLHKKVLLIDCDMRKSVLASRIGAGPVPFGLSHFLSGQCVMEDMTYAVNVPGLYIQFAGPAVPNPTELLSSVHFERLIQSFRELCDYIIVDAPPLGMVIDAAIAAKQCDGSIIAMESGTIKYRLAQNVKSKLENSGCPILGVILNKVDRKKNGGYYGKYYGKYYGNYYE